MYRRLTECEAFERLWDRVDSSAGPDGCWPTSGYAVEGYPLIKFSGVLHRAGRVVYRRMHGELQRDFEVCHCCDNPSCLNPRHLYAGTAKQNADDRTVRGRGARGERVHRARFTAERVLLVRARYLGGAAIAQLARDFGVSTHAVWCIVHRRTWKHV